MACGCVDGSCGCVLVGGPNITVSGAGTASNPYVASTGSETAWTGSNTDGGIEITSGGVNGHSPVLNLVLDPASPAELSVSEDGLSVECCTPTAPLVIVDEDYTATDNDAWILVDTTDGPITIDVSGIAVAGTELHIKDYGNGGVGNASVNNITIDFGGYSFSSAEGAVPLDLTGISVMSTDGQATRVIFDGIGNFLKSDAAL